jgi:hypothetical protein
MSPWPTFDAASSPIKTPRREKPKDPITFPETHRDLMLAVRLMFTIQLGTPRGRSDEYSSKVFPLSETKVYRSEGEEAKRLKVMLASLRQLRKIYKAPRPSFALPAATRNLHTTQPNTLLSTYDEVVNLTRLLETKE